jgi:hypothetical protein
LKTTPYYGQSRYLKPSPIMKCGIKTKNSFHHLTKTDRKLLAIIQNKKMSQMKKSKEKKY